MTYRLDVRLKHQDPAFHADLMPWTDSSLLETQSQVCQLMSVFRAYVQTPALGLSCVCSVVEIIKSRKRCF